MTMQRFEVGGCVRDDIMGIASKDVDFTVVGVTFDEMLATIEAEGFTPFKIKPEFVTVSATVPKGHPLRARTGAVDFVLARKDSATGDGRRPDFVEHGTLADDLARRDFTVNAIARDEGGNLIDPHGGIEDIRRGILRFVGNPADRIAEDGLRVMRAFRFKMTKGFNFSTTTDVALRSPLAAEMLHKVSVDRIRDEVNKMLAVDALGALDMLRNERVVTPEVFAAIFRDGLRLDIKATTAK